MEGIPYTSVLASLMYAICWHDNNLIKVLPSRKFSTAWSWFNWRETNPFGAAVTGSKIGLVSETMWIIVG